MNGKLDGRVALVTGAGRGIGRAIAEGLASEGASVILTATTVSQLEETVASIKQAGGKALMRPADITIQDDVQRVVVEGEAAFGPPDILVNNAAIEGPAGRLWELDPEAWRRTLEVDVFGQFLVTRAVVPGMIRLGKGWIINFTSGIATSRGGFPGYSAYGASKAAVIRMTETLAAEAKVHGISVFAVNPGTIQTKMLESLRDADLEDLAPGRATRVWEADEPMENPVRLCSYLATGAADELSGAYLDAREDVGDMVQRASEINEQDLYRMRISGWRQRAPTR